MKDDSFFVGIYNPEDARRNILESSRELVKSLQSYDKLNNVREQKLLLFKEMKTVMEELDLLVGKLKTKLPRSHLRKVHEHVSADFKNVNPKFVSELEKLEEQLSSIESELSKLN